MDAIDKHELLSKAISLLDAREAKPEGAYFFCGEDDDEGLSYCYDCIHTLRPNAVYGWDADFIGGGSYEHDGCETCEHCGKVLDYTLTDYGVQAELHNFLEYGFDWSSPQECYELARVAHGMLDTSALRDDLLHILLMANNVPPELVHT